MITPLFRAQVFAMYLGQPIVAKGKNQTLSKQAGGYTDWSLVYMHPEEADHLMSIGHGEMKPYAIGFGKNRMAIDRYHLFLTPISLITIKDMAEVGKIVNLNITEFSNLFYKADIPGEGHKKYEHHFPIDTLSYKMADYLRSRGYALPIDGKTLFELDLATDKTKYEFLQTQ